MLMKKATAALASLLATASLTAGCAATGSNEAGGAKPLSGKRIALLTVTQACDSCVKVTQAAKETAENAGAKVQIFVQEYDPALQAQQVNQAISQHVDLVILWPADAGAVLPSLIRLKQAKIPVVLLNGLVDVDDKSLFKTFAGPNDIESGELAAQALIKGFQGKGFGDSGSIVIIQGSPGVPASILREKGFRDYLGAHAPGIKIVGAQPGNWDQTQATDAAGALLTTYPDVKGIFAVADNMLAGAITAADRAGRDPSKMVMVGMDCTIEGVQNIRAGKQDATVLKNPFEEGRNAAEAAADVLTGSPGERYVFDQNPTVTSSNLDACDEAVGAN